MKLLKTKLITNDKGHIIAKEIEGSGNTYMKHYSELENAGVVRPATDADYKKAYAHIGINYEQLPDNIHAEILYILSKYTREENGKVIGICSGDCMYDGEWCTRWHFEFDKP